jgi:hypothetical protein
VAICMFDGNLIEADAVRVALNDYAAQRARGARLVAAQAIGTSAQMETPRC